MKDPTPADQANGARFDTAELVDFGSALLCAQGVPEVRSRVIARGFLEADLLGFDTHGFARLPANLEWLASGRTDATAEPVIVSNRSAVACWDARTLPGPWIMHLAVQHAMACAAQSGAYTLTLRRCQHIACLAAALVPLAERGLIGMLMASSPGEAYVSPFGGSQRLFSNNPLAFVAPTSGEPLLFDVSMAITAGGRVARAAREGCALPEPALKSIDGISSRDPAVMAAGGSVMPIGGLGHGHKGHALTLMTEVLTQALSGHGRATQIGSSEENSVFLQVFDPLAFGSRDDYYAQIDHLVHCVSISRPDDAEQPVRVPGQRAWRRRAEQLRGGVALYPGIFDALLPFAAASHLIPPSPVRQF